jgi:hypothetical protein
MWPKFDSQREIIHLIKCRSLILISVPWANPLKTSKLVSCCVLLVQVILSIAVKQSSLHNVQTYNLITRQIS